MLEQYDLGNLMVLDIETVPQYSSFEEVPEHFQKLWELKTQYQRKEETAKSFYERAGIWAEFGKIICISVGIFAGGKKTSLRVKSFSSHDEKEILEDFSALLNTDSTNPKPVQIYDWTTGAPFAGNIIPQSRL